MGNKLKVEIVETAEELKQQLKKQKQGHEKERLQMLYWLKSGQVKSRQELAKRLARNESTIYRWLKKYRTVRVDWIVRSETSTWNRTQD